MVLVEDRGLVGSDKLNYTFGTVTSLLETTTKKQFLSNFTTNNTISTMAFPIPSPFVWDASFDVGSALINEQVSFELSRR